jgi:hypothetical protein
VDVDRHAFVGLVPLHRLDAPGSVPFDGSQPGRSLAYDDALAASVSTHLPVARPVDDWRDRTTDGVHPNEAGHAVVAGRVAGWLGGGDRVRSAGPVDYDRQYDGVRRTSTGTISFRPIHMRNVIRSFVDRGNGS